MVYFGKDGGFFDLFFLEFVEELFACFGIYDDCLVFRIPVAIGLEKIFLDAYRDFGRNGSQISFHLRKPYSFIGNTKPALPNNLSELVFSILKFVSARQIHSFVDELYFLPKIRLLNKRIKEREDKLLVF